ncbi:MAG: hypothetical protein J5749_03935, partial [Lachnospiraceae bacterium]|nr:hypothetical protein [Lachnospiraceae bacterium]
MKKRALSLLLILVLVISTLYARPVNAGQSKGIEEYREVLASVESSGELPAKFDLRDYGLVTPKRNQGKYGTCWAFATIAALESNALVKGYGEYNLSERYLAWCAKHIIDTDNSNIAGEGISTSAAEWYNGGSASIAGYSLMNGLGIGLESEYPYKDIIHDIYSDCIGKEVFRCSRVSSVSRNDETAIKYAVMKYGAAVTSIRSASDTSKIFSNRNHSYYMSEDWYRNNKSKLSGGHVLVIIGWDDYYSRTNFATPAPKDGAWIVKNSGGLNYSYISYCNYIDPTYDQLVYSFEVAPVETYDWLYTYDGGIGLTEVKSTNDIAISFKANSDETLTGVAVKLEGKTQATIKVYNNTASVESINENNCIHTETVSLTENGYQTLQFSNGVNVSANDDIFVTVHFFNPVTYYIDNEWRSGTITSHASANPNETFIKKNNGSWEDLVNYGKANACIKVLARNGHNRRPLTLNNSHLTISNSKEATIDLSWKEVEGATTYEIYRKAEGEWKYTLLKIVDSTTLKYSDTKLTLGKKYTYKV